MKDVNNLKFNKECLIKIEDIENGLNNLENAKNKVQEILNIFLLNIS